MQMQMIINAKLTEQYLQTRFFVVCRPQKFSTYLI